MKPQNLRRQISESGDNLYINKWWTGLVTQRSPLYTPVSSLGLQLIAKHDTLADGLNTELSNNLTLVRSPGFTRYCSVAFGSSEYPLAFYSFKKLTGTIYPLVDTSKSIYNFGASALTKVTDKNTTAQTSFQRSGSMVYFCNGSDALKWDGTKNWVSGSEQKFNDTTLWANAGGTVTDNAITDPNGGSTASKIIGGVSGDSNLFQTVAIQRNNSVTLQVTFSIYLKAPIAHTVRIMVKDSLGGSDRAHTDCAVTTAWQRFSVTATLSAGDNGCVIYLGTNSSIGNGVEVDMWGAQLETAASASSYESNTTRTMPVSKWGIAGPVSAPTATPASGSLSPAIGYQWRYAYKNSRSGHVSTASAASASSGAQTSKHFTVAGVLPSGSDLQIDTVEIYRTVDGGATFFLVTDLHVNPFNSTWSYVDNNADTALNNLIQAEIADANDPPASGISVVTSHMGRMWVATGRNLYFSGGPDTTTGVGDEAFPPANVFAFPDAITAMCSMSQGLMVFTAADAYVVYGQNTESFWYQQWQTNFGVANQNCVCQDGDTVFIYTSKQQLFELADSLSELGYAIGDQLLSNFPAASSSLALHRSGTDVGLFISNGTDTIFRCGFNIASQQPWNPKRQPAGGVGNINSIEVTTGVYKLLVGRAAGSGYILARDIANWQDDGASYDAYATVGSLLLSPPGQAAIIGAIITEINANGATYPTLGVLLNEVSGSFATLPAGPSDPTEYSGTSLASSTVTSKVHYLKAASTPLGQKVRHLRVKVDFGTENTKGELYGLAVQ